MAISSATHSVRHRAFARRRVQLALLGGLASLALASGARAEAEPGAPSLGQDTFMSGQDVHLTDEVHGDAVLLGGSIDVSAAVHGDGVFAGHELALRGPFGSDLYAAGATVQLDGDVAGNARIAGGTSRSVRARRSRARPALPPAARTSRGTSAATSR